MVVGCQPYAPAAFTPRKYSWYSFLLEVRWEGFYVNEKSTDIPGKDPVSILQEAGWAPGSVWMGGKSRPHRDSIPDRPARSQSLYRLSYPSHALQGSNRNKRVFIFTGKFSLAERKE